MHFIWYTKMYISFPIQSCRSKYACLGSTRNHPIIYYSTMRKKIWFLSVGINDHKIIFTIFYVWVDISLVCLMLDVVFFHWCLLSGNKPTMHVKNPVFCNTTIFLQEWASMMNQMNVLFFPIKYISWSWKVNTEGAWNLLYF